VLSLADLTFNSISWPLVIDELSLLGCHQLRVAPQAVAASHLLVS
jgi:hypothetical protein